MYSNTGAVESMVANALDFDYVSLESQFLTHLKQLKHKNEKLNCLIFSPTLENGGEL